MKILKTNWRSAIKLGNIIAPSANRISQFATPKLVLVPTGSFPVKGSCLFGDQSSSTANARVKITQPFYMGRFPVTQEEWAAFDQGTNYSSRHGRNVAEGDPTRARHPVTNVNDADCAAYVAWLNTLGLTNAEGKELEFFVPTAAQWEYAARGEKGRTYPWGNGWKNHPSRVNATYPVGQFPGQELGAILRGTGIVWERTSTRYGNYPVDQTTDPTGPNSGENTEARGGTAWHGEQSPSFNGEARIDLNPEDRRGVAGFRVAARIKIQ